MAKRNQKIETPTVDAPSAPLASDKPSYVLPAADQFKIAADMAVFAFTCEMAYQPRTVVSQATLWPLYVAPQRSGTKSSHQFKFTCRSESCVAVMPSAALYAETGNPYPSDVTDKSIVVSSPKYDWYKPFVVVAHCVFNYLRTASEPVSASHLYYKTSVVADAIALMGKPISKPASNDNNALLDAITHTLRDLEACGLTIAQDAKRNQYSNFILQPALTPAS